MENEELKQTKESGGSPLNGGLEVQVVYATRDENNNIAIINGTCCSEGYCREYGCDFPNCATFSGEVFETEEKAKSVYSNLEIV